ncbi:hypothetical protein ACPOL_4117 [Acidisarcina polymorpha]|uniref:Uncharacterized protein n=1 Tax=Acidisarcina polymorpha TaxID=2211140 RepID=A0A2Z5G3M6_9BACT|nr:hypothetical protein ACPOL_4117 [Acidisarcina polymorpha]
MSTDEAHAEMDPFGSCLKAFFAAAGVGFDILDLIEVRAFSGHIT